MKLHLLGIPHTYTHPAFSCCAFTGKVLRFVPMMQAHGYEVIHYGNAGSTTLADKQVTILDRDKFRDLGGCEPEDAASFGDASNVGSRLYEVFNDELAKHLDANVEQGDIICCPFGTAHLAALSKSPGAKKAYWVETGIGYRSSFAPFRIFESNTWMYCTLGRMPDQGTIMGNDYWFVIPNYYRGSDWPVVRRPQRQLNLVNFMGRLNTDKGLQIVVELAKHRPNITFQICGPGTMPEWIIDASLPNLRVLPAINGDQTARAKYLGEPAAVLCPSRYVEPFCGVAAEALMCGTPVIASSFGAFREYIRPGANGFLCRTLRDWLHAVDAATQRPNLHVCPELKIGDDARNLFDVSVCGRRYDEAFRQIADLARGGWYADANAAATDGQTMPPPRNRRNGGRRIAPRPDGLPPK